MSFIADLTWLCLTWFAFSHVDACVYSHFAQFSFLFGLSLSILFYFFFCFISCLFWHLHNNFCVLNGNSPSKKHKTQFAALSQRKTMKIGFLTTSVGQVCGWRLAVGVWASVQKTFASFYCLSYCCCICLATVNVAKECTFLPRLPLSVYGVGGIIS